jgi:hypothetical protein
MNSDNASTQSRRGRPATGTNPAIGVRLPPDLLEALDRWRREQADPPGRPEAIRRLIEAGLAAKPIAPGSSTPGSARKPTSAKKPITPRAKKPTASDRQAGPAQSKESQIRALREQGI